jgi:hypothetical protein
MTNKIIRKEERIMRETLDPGELTVLLPVWRRIRKRGQVELHITETSPPVKPDIFMGKHLFSRDENQGPTKIGRLRKF